MVNLLVVPDFDFKRGFREAGDYAVMLPQNRTVLWVMFCTSANWAVVDTQDDCVTDLNNALGTAEWQVEFFDGSPKNRPALVKRLEQLDKLNSRVDLQHVNHYFDTVLMPPWLRKRA